MDKNKSNHSDLLKTDDDLLHYCKDYREWPKSWMGVREDLEYGQQILEEFKPFILYLLNKGYSRKTVKKHIDNLWCLGGEIIREINTKSSLRKVDARSLILESIGKEGGPLLHNTIPENAQYLFDATCRKYHNYLTNEKQKV